MEIAILGFAGQGRSAYEYWNRDGNELTICDQDAKLDIPAGAESQLGDDYLKNLDRFDLIIRTPVLHPRDIVAANSELILGKVTTVTNEFFKVCPSKNIIGITGTKGKGTTSALIANILEACGYRVHLGGNIGIPPLELLKNDIKPDDWVVLELANFQLIDLKTSPHIGVVLMVVPEHLDWHTDLEEYISAKQQLFMHQKSEDIAIYYAKSENSESVASASEGKLIPYFAPPGAIIENDDIVIGGQSICSTDELKLLGKHNWQNACAAVTAVWQVTQDVEAIRKVLATFTGLPYRIELRREVDGVRYYNDSFATAPDATVAAVEAISGHKVMILGGFERGLNLNKLASIIAEHGSKVRKVVVIGASGDRLIEALEKANFHNYIRSQAKDMATIVNQAKEQAQPNDAVVLSPGFASFDMFKNFEERGVAFNDSVKAL